jgi:hypothetical protein
MRHSRYFAGRTVISNKNKTSFCEVFQQLDGGKYKAIGKIVDRLVIRGSRDNVQVFGIGFSSKNHY